MSTPWLLFAVLCGAGLGIGAYTFQYADGTSYLSSNPAACANCHIMWSEFHSWQKASHHAAAVCVDCHLPHDGLAKWTAKAVHGYRHSKAFTFQDFEEPIRVTPGDQETLLENCLRCHADLVHDLVAGATSPKHGIRCVHCHADVGHGPMAGLGGADREDTEGEKP